MTLQEKTEYLRRVAMTEARKQAQDIVAGHRQSLERILEQHKEELKYQAQTRIKAEKVAARQQLNMVTFKAQLELKRELVNTQKRIKQSLFSEVRKQLNDFMQTDEYKRHLVLYIEKAVVFAGRDMLTIYINASDEDKKTYLEEHTGLTLTISKEDFIGGVRSVIPERNILIDHSYKGGLEQEYRDFVFEEAF